jgi:hypothetical protein
MYDDLSSEAMFKPKMQGLLRFLLTTDMTLTTLAQARGETLDELSQNVVEALGEDQGELVQLLRQAEQECAAAELQLELARSTRHHWRRELAVASASAGSLPLPKRG